MGRANIITAEGQQQRLDGGGDDGVLHAGLRAAQRLFERLGLSLIAVSSIFIFLLIRMIMIREGLKTLDFE